MISERELEQIAESLFNLSPEKKVNQCGRLVCTAEFELEDKNIPYNRIIGSVRMNPIQILIPT